MINGFLLINKEPGVTSSKVVQIIKKKFLLKKVGHLGTLDPMATGLLILAINRGTKFSSLFFESHKSYRAEVTLGIQTDTDDAEGEIIFSREVSSKKEEVEEVLFSFLGDSQQFAPNYSALKYKGKPMYKYAREGIMVEKEARKISIDKISNSSIKLPKVSFDIACSKGTYIRAIARDLGNKLGCGGHLSSLIRTSQQQFFLNEAKFINEINLEDLIPLDKAFNDLDSISLTKSEQKAFINGLAIDLKLDHSNLLRVYDDQHEFIAIGRNSTKGFKHEYLV